MAKKNLQAGSGKLKYMQIQIYRVSVRLSLVYGYDTPESSQLCYRIPKIGKCVWLTDSRVSIKKRDKIMKLQLVLGG